jgi:uncharacterized membrane protein YgaE (UPF0421/DUF939 family)
MLLMKPNSIDHSTETRSRRLSRAATTGAALAVAAFISYELTTRILTSTISSPHDQLLGGMWSVVSTLFVCRESYNESLSAALSRTSATLSSFILCLVYLLLFPSSSLGMAILIAIGTILMIMINRPSDVMTTAITIAVVMVVAEVSPQHAWQQPILRLLDTLIGVAVGIAAVWIGRSLRSPAHLETEKTKLKGEIRA